MRVIKEYSLFLIFVIATSVNGQTSCQQTASPNLISDINNIFGSLIQGGFASPALTDVINSFTNQIGGNISLNICDLISELQNVSNQITQLNNELNSNVNQIFESLPTEYGNFCNETLQTNMSTNINQQLDVIINSTFLSFATNEEQNQAGLNCLNYSAEIASIIEMFKSAISNDLEWKTVLSKCFLYKQAPLIQYFNLYVNLLARINTAYLGCEVLTTSSMVISDFNVQVNAVLEYYQAWTMESFINDAGSYGYQSIIQSLVNEIPCDTTPFVYQQTEINSQLNTDYSYWNWHVITYSSLSENQFLKNYYWTFPTAQCDSQVVNTNCSNLNAIVSYYNSNQESPSSLLNQLSESVFIPSFIQLSKGTLSPLNIRSNIDGTVDYPQVLDYTLSEEPTTIFTSQVANKTWYNNASQFDPNNSSFKALFSFNIYDTKPNYPGNLSTVLDLSNENELEYFYYDYIDAVSSNYTTISYEYLSFGFCEVNSQFASSLSMPNISMPIYYQILPKIAFDTQLQSNSDQVLSSYSASSYIDCYQWCVNNTQNGCVAVSFLTPENFTAPIENCYSFTEGTYNVVSNSSWTSLIINSNTPAIQSPNVVYFLPDVVFTNGTQNIPSVDSTLSMEDCVAQCANSCGCIAATYDSGDYNGGYPGCALFDIQSSITGQGAQGWFSFIINEN